MPTLNNVRPSWFDDAEIRELFDRYRAQMPERVQKLQQLLAAGEFAELARAAHQIKGSAAGYGFPELSTIAAEIELTCIQAPSPFRLSALLQEFDRFANR